MGATFGAPGILPVLGGSHAVGVAEGAGEVGGARKAPVGGDRLDGACGQVRGPQVMVRMCEALPSDVGGDRGAVSVAAEEAVQGPQRDVVSGGDCGRRQVRVAQVSADEILDLQKLQVLAGLGGSLLFGFGAVRQPGGDQVDEYVAEPLTVGGPIGASVGGQAGEETREQAADAFVPCYPGGEYPVHAVRGQRDDGPRDLYH